MKRILLFFSVIILLVSCTNYSAITKRKYRKGFYTSLYHKVSDFKPGKQSNNIDSIAGKRVIIIKNNGDTINAKVNFIDNSAIEYVKVNNLSGPKYTNSISTIKKIIDKNTGVDYLSLNNSPVPKLEKDSIIPDTTHSSFSDKDLMITTNGDTLEIILESINHEEIQYKKYSNPNGPSYIKEKEKVKKIIAERGNEIYASNTNAIDEKIEVANPKPTRETKQSSPNKNIEKNTEEIPEKQPLKTHKAGVLAFVFGIIALGMFLIGTISLGLALSLSQSGAGWDALVYVFFSIFSAFVAWIQAIITGIFAFVLGLISVSEIYNKKSKKYRKDYRAIFGLIAGTFILALLILSVFIAMATTL